MGTDLKAPIGGPFHGPQILGQGMAEVYCPEDPVIHRLKAEFQTNVVFSGQPFKKQDSVGAEGVGACPDRNADDIRMGEGAVEQLTELFHRGIGIGEFLEIDDEFFTAKATAMVSYPVRHVAFYGDYREGPRWGEGAVVAVDAPPGPFRAVPVGTGETPVHVYLADAVTEPSA